MIRRTRSLWRRTQLLLREHRSEIMILGAARTAVALLCTAAGVFMQQILAAQTHLLILPAAMLISLLAAAPMRTETVRHLSELTGVLNEDDLGFLNCSSKLWLWQRAALLRLICGILLFLACAPMLLLAFAARIIWLTMPAAGDDLLPLLTVLHLTLLIPAAAWLPLRVYTAGTALPFTLLKIPERSPAAQLRLAFRLTRRQTADILMQRLICLPALLLPYPAVAVLPTLLSAELLRYHRNLMRT